MKPKLVLPELAPSGVWVSSEPTERILRTGRGGGSGNGSSSASSSGVSGIVAIGACCNGAERGCWSSAIDPSPDSWYMDWAAELVGLIHPSEPICGAEPDAGISRDWTELRELLNDAKEARD